MDVNRSHKTKGGHTMSHDGSIFLRMVIVITQQGTLTGGEG
jgi:hypothetical protein